MNMSKSDKTHIKATSIPKFRYYKLFLYKILLPTVPFFLFLAIWWVLTLFDIPKYILPSPFDVILGLTDPRWQWLSQTFATLKEVLGGFVLAVFIGIFLGLVVSWNDFLRKMLMAFLVFFNSMPKVALAPLVLVWFGFGIGPNIVMAFLISFFPILLNTARGVGDVPPEMIELALTFNTPKWKRFLKIRIPYALPFIMTGIKLASLMAVTGAIVGEFIASEVGLAAVIIQAQTYIETGVMVGAVLLISLLAMAMFGIINFIEIVFMPWTKIKESE